MNKFYWTFALTLLLAPAAAAASQEPDIIYVDGKPVYIGGLEPAADTQVKKTSVEEEIARTNVPGDIYRGTVLGAQQPANKGDVFGRKEVTYRGKVLGDHTTPSTEYEKRTPEVYRGKVFGKEQKKYASDTLGARELAKTKLVYDTSLVRAIKTGDADRVRTLIYANVDVNERNYAGITPLGMTFSEMASMTGGGVQTPGFMGHGKHYIASHKFLKAEGGVGRLVWLPKELKDQIRDKLNETAKDMYDIDNFADMVADETNCPNGDPEELLAFLSEVGHPVLSMDPLDI